MGDYDTKKCIACYSQINIEASKCLHCETHQNWRRYVGAWGPLVSLFLGLAAVTSLVLPQLSYLTLPEVGYSVTNVSASFRSVHVLFNNNGKRPLLVSQVTVYYPNGAGILKSVDDDYIILGNTERILNLEWDLDCEICTPRPSESLSLIYNLNDPLFADFDPSQLKDDDPFPYCGLAFTVYQAGVETIEAVRYEFLDRDSNVLSCSQEFYEFLIGRSGYG